jgi:hypothetical protein
MPRLVASPTSPSNVARSPSDPLHPKPVEVVQPARQASQVADPVSASVLLGSQVDLVADSVSPLWRPASGVTGIPMSVARPCQQTEAVRRRLVAQLLIRPTPCPIPQT